MREYPKMLYIGTAQSHKHKTARNEQHEAELRELGFVNFVDLEKEEPVKNDVGSASTESVEPDYSKATAKELREALDAKGIKYLQRDNVDTLRALLTQPQKTEE